MTPDSVAAEHHSEALERLLNSAYTLFCARGVRDVGVNEIIAHAGVARATLYNHFASKDDLVVAVLERRQQLWTRDWLQAQVEIRGKGPEAQLLAIFDLFDEWFHRPDYEGCMFINLLLEMGETHPVGRASLTYMQGIQTYVRQLAARASLRAPTTFAHAWQILMKGSIIAASQGDRNAAKRAKEIGRLLLSEHRSAAA